MATAKKSFILEFDDNLSDQHKKWTKEAVEKFVGLFPDLADHFDMQFGQNEFLDQALDADGKLDLRKWTELMREKSPPHLASSDPVHIAISSKKTNMGYGITLGDGVCVSAGACGNDEAYFKDIVMHELGHVFMATHEARRNVVNNLGEHCTDSDCLMYEYAYMKENANRRRNNKKDNPFCDDCMRSMKSYMEVIFEIAQNNSLTIDNENKDQSEDEEQRDIPEVNGTVKAVWREYANSVAQKMNATYSEDKDASEYSATLTQPNGKQTLITATSHDRVGICAKDEKGKPAVPDMAVFEELVAKARRSNLSLNFGNIKTPEFKARLMIACLSANPPMEAHNVPELNEEFLQSIDKDSASKLKILQEKTKYRQDKKTNKDSPVQEDESSDSKETLSDEELKKRELEKKQKELVAQQEEQRRLEAEKKKAEEALETEKKRMQEQLDREKQEAERLKKDFFFTDSEEEMKYLDAYRQYAENNKSKDEVKKRTQDDLFWDCAYLIASARCAYKETGTYPKASPSKIQLLFNKNWDSGYSINEVIRLVYQSQISVRYPTNLYDDGTGITQEGKKLDKIMTTNRAGIVVDPKNTTKTWAVRAPKGVKIKKSAERYAMNIQPSADFIEQLDAFSEKYHVGYKMARPTDLHMRCDSVILCCPEALTPEAINELQTITEPHIRKSSPENINNLEGDKVAEGVARIVNPTADEVTKLATELGEINPLFKKAMEISQTQGVITQGQMDAYRSLGFTYKEMLGVKTTQNNRDRGSQPIERR